MRKVILRMHTSLDGYVARVTDEWDKRLDWMFSRFDAELDTAALETLSQIDTFLMGRVNYAEMVHYWPNAEGPFADIMNNSPKIVFSKTLEQLDWQNARLATGTPAEEIAQLKRQPGKDIGVTGGANFVHSLTQHGLIDEYELNVHPVILGSGLPLFAEPINLKLVNTRSLGSGIVILTYQPDA